MNSTSKILLVIVILEAAALAWLIFDKFQQKEMIASVSEELVEVKSEKAEIEQELQSMYDQYETLKTDNKDLNAKLEEEKQKIKETLDQLRRVKSGDRMKIKQLEEETETLKSIMKDYIRQIDKLNTENKRLVSENKEIMQNYEDEKARTETLAYVKDSLSNQVKIAKELKAENIIIIPLNKRDKDTKRASKFKKVKVCFTIDDNVLAAHGNRNAYVRIAGPDGIILMNTESGMFIYNGKEIAYSSKRNLTYEGKKTDVCMYWTADAEQVPGRYSIDIFMDGAQIGEAKFTLK
jgi:myosin heavy subunit